MQVKVKKLWDTARLSTYATEGSACFDLYWSPEYYGAYSSRTVNDSARTFETGLCFEIPVGYYMAIYSRSGHGFNHSVRLINCTGIIDSDFRGQVLVKLISDDFDSSPHLQIHPGDRIAQAHIKPVERTEFLIVAELSTTARGTSGFGGSGR